jgi:hypothetical protein
MGLDSVTGRLSCQATPSQFDAQGHHDTSTCPSFTR